MASGKLQPAHQPDDPLDAPSPAPNLNPPDGQTFTVRQEMVSYSGPLPTPEALAGFEQAFKGCAERIVAMAERQAKHRQECERLMLDAPIADEKSARLEAKRGQTFAFTLALSAFGIAAIIVIASPTAAGATVATAMCGTTIGGIVTAFVVGRKTTSPPKEKTSENKMEPH